MALTQREKEILGYMTDEGQLRGELRIEVGQSDERAREVIAEFSQQVKAYAPIQIQAMTQDIELKQAKIDSLNNILTLLGE